MIVDELYTTGETHLTHYGNDYEDIISGSVSGDDGTTGDAYYLGWISSETLPAMMKRCYSYKLVEANPDDPNDHSKDKIVVETLTEDGNFPCGYIWGNGGSAVRWAGYNPDCNGLQMVNQLFPMYSCAVPVKVRLNFGGLIFQPQGQDEALFYPTSGTQPGDFGRIELDPLQFIKLGQLRDIATFTTLAERTLTFSANGETYNIELTSEILNAIAIDNGENTGNSSLVIDINTESSGGTRHVKLWCTGASIVTKNSNNSQYDTTTYGGIPVGTFNPGNGENSTMLINFFAKTKLSEYTLTVNGIKEEGDQTEPEHESYEFAENSWNDSYLLSGNSYTAVVELRNDFAIRSAGVSFVDKIIPYGAHAEVLRSQIWSSQHFYYISGNVCFINSNYGGGSPSVSGWLIHCWYDYYKLYALMYRVSIMQQYQDGYTLGQTYATNVTKRNEFLAQLKTGDLDDPTFKNGLRPWQWNDEGIQGDEFTQEDVPDDDGGGGSDDDSDSTPDEGKPDQDEVDFGPAPTPYRLGMASMSATRFYLMDYDAHQAFMTNLAKDCSETQSTPDDVTKPLYLLGKIRQTVAGGVNADTHYDTADEHFVGNFIVSCRWYPFDLTTFPVDGTLTDKISFGYRGATFDVDDGSCRKDIKQLVYSNAVNIYVKNRKGSTNITECRFWDFEPYAKYTLILPFIGEVPIPARIAVCSRLTVLYQIDLTTGTCQATVTAKGGYNTKDGFGETFVVQKTGVCGIECSITGNDSVRQADQQNIARLQQNLTRVSTIVSDVNANMPNYKSYLSSAEKGFSEGGAEGAGMGLTRAIIADRLEKVMNIPNNFERVIGNNTRNTIAATNVTSASRSVPWSLLGGTNISPSAGLRQVAMKVERARIFEPNGYGHTFGFPLEAERTISQMEGFVQCASVDVSKIGGGGEPYLTEGEQAELNTILKNGFFVKK